MRGFLVVVVLAAVLAGCAEPKAQPGPAPPTVAPPAPDGDGGGVSPPPPAPPGEPRREEWRGQVAVATPGASVSDEPHRFVVGADTVLTVTVVAEDGRGVGSLRLTVWDAEGNVVLKGEGPSPLSVKGPVSKGNVAAHVTAARGAGAAWQYDATAEWTE